MICHLFLKFLNAHISEIVTYFKRLPLTPESRAIAMDGAQSFDFSRSQNEV